MMDRGNLIVLTLKKWVDSTNLVMGSDAGRIRRDQ